ncbi:MAG: carbohydrate ABC transporter permease [Spirochaetes bacterium]|nr:MAG: carbohydrate ABC transporter permease [Spirochaetota bacterium]
MDAIGGVKHRSSLWLLPACMIMLFFSFLTLAPLVWLLYSSFKPHQAIIRNVFSLPETIHFMNYVTAWERGNLGLYFVNSITYTSTATAITTFLALAAGYGLAKFRYRVTGIIYAFFIMGLLITPHSVLVPLFVLETSLNIDDTRIGVIIPYVAFGLPFLIYLATSYIRGLPDELEQAALCDGAGYLQIFWRIIIPLCAPVTSTMIIFAFISNWNEFVFVFVLTSKVVLRSLPVGINSFAGGLTRDYGLQFAALVIGTLPMIIFYIFFHDQIARGFAAGAIKG